VAGPTRQFAPIPPGGIVTEALPEITSDWVDFYRNVNDVLDGWDTSPERVLEKSLVKIPEVRRVLTVMEAVRKSAETSQAVALE
jgi:hypothetical protein